MKATIPLGRYAGIPIGAHWSVLVIVLLLAELLAVGVLPAAAPELPGLAYWSTAVAAAVLFLASLLAHELAHAALARRFGIRVKSITLWMLGGAAMLDDEPPTPRADTLVAGIGPVTSAALAAVYLAAATGISPGWLSGLPAAALTCVVIIDLTVSSHITASLSSLPWSQATRSMARTQSAIPQPWDQWPSGWSWKTHSRGGLAAPR